MNHNQPNESDPSFNHSRTSSVESLRERNGLILGTDIREPMTGREAVYSPYEVPPFFIPSVSKDEVPGHLTLHQEEVMAMHDALIARELAGRVSPSVLEYIRNSIHARMTQQLGMNSHCYLARLNKDEATMNESCYAALEGTASVAQAAEARAIFKMVSAPLAEITLIGDKRKEYLPDMIRAVSDYVGHDISKTAPYRIEVIGFDHDPDYRKTTHIGAMRVMMKRHHGYTPDGEEVKQRTLAIIDLSRGSGLDPTITQAIFDAYQQNITIANKKAMGKTTLDMYADQEEHLQRLYRDRYYDVNNQPKDRLDVHIDSTNDHQVAYADLPEVRGMLDGLIQRDMQSHIVLARNETIYEYSEATDIQHQQIWRFPIANV
jgi:hypothetical protein